MSLDFQSRENHVTRRIAVFRFQGIGDAVAAGERTYPELHVPGADEVVDAARRDFADGKDRMRRHKARYNFAPLKQFVILNALSSGKQRDAVLEDQLAFGKIAIQGVAG